MRKTFIAGALACALGYAASSSPTALADAAARSDLAGVRALIAQKADVNTPQVDGTTALHWAVHHDDIDTVKALLAAGANAATTNRYGITPLSEACQNANEEIVALLVKAGADVNVPHAEGETPLMTAARSGNPEAVKVLLDNGAQVNVAEEWRGQTALMWAAAEGHSEVVKLLLKHGALMNARSKVFDFTALRPKPGSVGMNFPRGGFTALLFAAREGHFDTVKTLVEAGAEVNLPEPDGTTALLMAIINFHYDIAAYLLEHGGDPNAADIRGRTPLYGAIDQKNLDVSNRPPAKVEDVATPESLIKALLAKGANPNAPLLKSIAARAVLDGADGTLGAGATPFLRAARGGDVETMKLLLDNKANLRATTATGVNALMIAAGAGWRDGKSRAAEANSVEAVKMLVSAGLDVNYAASNGETALHGAAGRGADSVVQTLVDLGADVNIKDRTNRTPYDVANGAGAGVRVPHESTAALLAKLGGVTGLTPEAPVVPSATVPVALDPVQTPTAVIKRAIIEAEPKAPVSKPAP